MRRVSSQRWQLVGDLGGTHVRFGLVGERSGAMQFVARYRADDFPDVESVLRQYLGKLESVDHPRRACLAVAAPVDAGRAVWTNRDWALSAEALARSFALDQVVVINDFAAVALSLPDLLPHDRRQIGGGTGKAGCALAVLGAGTGLGMAVLAPCDDSPHVLESEGGHALLAPTDEIEHELLSYLCRLSSPVSWERVLCGPGLVNLYRFCVDRAGASCETLAPPQISQRALSGACPHCRLALDLFYRLLGSAAADLALTTGARAGVYLAGEMLNQLGHDLARSGFRDRFEDREGRYRGYMAEIPTYLLTLAEPGLHGAARYLRMKTGTAKPAQ